MGFQKVEAAFSVQKVEPDERLVFGWFYVCEKGGEQVVDHSGDVIDIADIEKCAYDFVISARIQGDQHVKKGVGLLVESIVFTKEKQEVLGIDLGKIGWWGGFKVHDDELWQKIKKGERPAFSIAGFAESEEINDEEA